MSAGPERWYRVQHRTSYSYSDTVSASYGRGYLRPRDLPTQRCHEFELTVDPAPSDLAESLDVYGNACSYFHVTRHHRWLEVTATSTVSVGAPAPVEAGGAGWESARPAADRDPLALEFTAPSPMAESTAAVNDYARSCFPPERPLLDAVRDLNSRIHLDFAYRSGSTTVGTSLATLMADRSGVCQDFAHLAVACLRSRGLAARYVSGYLATDPPPGQQRVVGADATHAWAAVRLSEGSWLAFDPTNDQLVDQRYITVAWGRDYGDVPPLRGVIFTDATSSTMTVSVDVAAVAAPSAWAEESGGRET